MEKLDKRKVLGTVVGGIVFLVCILFLTYAYYTWKSGNTIVSVNIQDAQLECTPGANVNATGLGPVFDYKDGVSATFSVDNGGSRELNFRVELNITSIDSELLVESFKYILLRDPNGETSYTEEVTRGDFSTFVVGYNTLVEAEAIAGNKTYSYKFIVYIDGTVYNDSNMQDKSLLGELVICGDEAGESVPNLDIGLIPVYYDDTSEVWKKADSTNSDNSWYSYRQNRWANAVLVSDSTKRSTYLSADIGTTVNESDITAFYVWIPRFKYRVWNITRQPGDESTYAYPAYSNGIDIEFENGTNSTGNVECNYRVSSTSDETTLADVCVYNGIDTITTTSGNKNYTDAWYTHPAFTFGDKELKGFWIGKFETTGTEESPTIKPDLTSLRISHDVSPHFIASKKFQNYGLSSDIDAHMLTNLEWGAVAYLTHSIYGLCDGNSCRDAYVNNSDEYFTGRSGGALAGSNDLMVKNVYPSNSSSTYLNHTYGYYNYKGYFLDYNGNITTIKDISKVASTTGNITGVYDMSGGAEEHVMGLSVDSSGSLSLGINWGASSSLVGKYYNKYSYYTTGLGIASWNRARLGDATAENVVDSESYYAAWEPGSGITGAYSTFFGGDCFSLYRGGPGSDGSTFFVSSMYSSLDQYPSFRSSLS